MEIHILSFGQIVEITGNPAFKVSDAKDTEVLKNKLIQMFPSLLSVKFSMAVNQKVVHVNTILNHEDTVALLPPFSGG